MGRWWARLAGYSEGYGRDLVAIAALILVGVVAEALKPWPLKLIVDYVLTQSPLPAGAAWMAHLPGARGGAGLLAWLAMTTVAVFAAARLAHALQARRQVRTGARMSAALGARLFDHIQRLGPRFHATARTGDLVRRVSVDAECVRELVLGVVLPLASALVSLAVMFAIMWQLHRALALVALLAAVPLGFFIRMTAARMTERTYEQQVEEGAVMALAEQTLTALPLVQAFNREEHEDERFRGVSGQARRAYMRATAAQLQFKFGVGAVTALGTALIMGVGGAAALAGSLTVGSMLVFMSYGVSLYAPLEDLAYLSSTFASSSARAKRVFEVLDAPVDVDDPEDAIDLPRLPRGGRGCVRMEAVRFGYEIDRAVLDSIDLEVRPGEVVALAGSSGAGKTTLVSLVPRFIDPWQGRVSIDGIDVRHVRVADLRKQVSIVLQDPWILPLSIAENIAYGRPQAGRDEVVAAARAAHADSFIERLPDGYETVVGERGATLSGGEKQRLAVARALLKDSSILILDEPTSALDAETEALVLDGMERLMEGRTVLVIAHRLSTLRRADRILVLEGGRIVESGSFDDLMAARGAFARLAGDYKESPADRSRRFAERG